MWAQRPRPGSAVKKPITVKPRFSNDSVVEQLGIRPKNSSSKCLWSRTNFRSSNTRVEPRRTEHTRTAGRVYPSRISLSRPAIEERLTSCIVQIFRFVRVYSRFVLYTTVTLALSHGSKESQQYYYRKRKEESNENNSWTEEGNRRRRREERMFRVP